MSEQTFDITREQVEQKIAPVRALDVLPLLEDEARGRQLATLKQGASPVPQKIAERGKANGGESRAAAALALLDELEQQLQAAIEERDNVET